MCDKYQNEVAKILFCIISFQTQQLLMTFLRYLFPGRELLLCIALLHVEVLWNSKLSSGWFSLIEISWAL